MNMKSQNSALKIVLLLVLLTAAGTLLRYLGMPYETSDLRVLTSWYQQMVDAGPSIHALASFRGDYPLSYIFIIWLCTKIPLDFAISIKLFSIVLDYLMAHLFGRVAEYLYPSKGYSYCLGYGIVMLLPMVFLNSAFWGQSDNFYAAFLIGMLLCLLKGKYPQMMIFLGLAFSYKLQTVFILPFILIYYWLEKKFSILQFAIVPVVMMIINIPAIIAGYPPTIAITQFMGQSGAYPWLYYFYPNFWFFFQGQPYFRFSLSAIFLAIMALLIFVILLVKKNVHITSDRVIPVVIWVMYTCVMFMPSMHERYTYMPEILATLYGIKHRDKLYLPIGLGLSVLPKYLWALGFIDDPIWMQWIASALCIAVYLIFTLQLWKELFCKTASGKKAKKSGGTRHA